MTGFEGGCGAPGGGRGPAAEALVTAATLALRASLTADYVGRARSGTFLADRCRYWECSITPKPAINRIASALSLVCAERLMVRRSFFELAHANIQH